MRTTLSMHHIARIEGHGNISLSIEDGRVSDVKMNVVEPARLFESMVGGRPFTQTSYNASRISSVSLAAGCASGASEVMWRFR